MQLSTHTGTQTLTHTSPSQDIGRRRLQTRLCVPQSARLRRLRRKHYSHSHRTRHHQPERRERPDQGVSTSVFYQPGTVEAVPGTDAVTSTSAREELRVVTQPVQDDCLTTTRMEAPTRRREAIIAPILFLARSTPSTSPSNTPQKRRCLPILEESSVFPCTLQLHVLYEGFELCFDTP